VAIKNIYLANLSELLYSTYSNNKNRNKIQKIIQSDGDRTLFYGSNNKLIVTSSKLDRNLVNDTLLLFKYKNITCLSPKTPSYSLSQDLFKDKKLKNGILKWLEKFSGTVNLIPYGSTAEFYQLIAWLKKKLPKLIINSSESPDRGNLFVRDYLDSKAGFRAVWDSSVNQGDIHAPLGFTCLNWKEVLQAVEYFYQQKKDFLLKLNYGVAGWGIEKFLTKQLLNHRELTAAIEKRCVDESVWRQGAIIVEQYIQADVNNLGGSPSIEYKITNKNGKSNLEYKYFCQQVLTDQGNFLGILIRNSLAKNKLFPKIKRSTEKFGRKIMAMGYVGTFDVDFIIGENDQSYALESNTRRTGGTHIWELANYLLKKKLNEYLIFSNDAFSIKKPVESYSQLKVLLKDLFWGEFAPKEGLIVTGTSMLKFNKFGYLILTKSENTLRKINGLINKRLS